MRVVCTIYYCDRCGEAHKTPYGKDFDESNPEPKLDSEGRPLCCFCKRAILPKQNYVKGTKEIAPTNEVHYFLTAVEYGLLNVFHHYCNVENNGFECSFCGRRLRCINPRCRFGTCEICLAPPGDCSHNVRGETDGVTCDFCDDILSCGNATCGMVLRPSNLEPEYGDKIWQTKMWKCKTECDLNCGRFFMNWFFTFTWVQSFSSSLCNDLHSPLANIHIMTFQLTQ